MTTTPQYDVRPQSATRPAEDALITNAAPPAAALDQNYPPEIYAYSEIATPLPGLDAIDEGAIARYRQQGYVAVENVFDASAIAAACAGLADLVGGRVTGTSYKIEFEARFKDSLATLSQEQREAAVRKLMYFTPDEPRLKAMSHAPQLLAVLRRLLGGEPEMFQDMALLKPPHGREKPWHQDISYFNYALDTRIVGVWIALDEATPQNGCMHVMPGGHHSGPQLHFIRRDWQICDTSITGHQITAVPLKPGGLMFFDGLLPHGTPRNPTAQRRRAVQFHYAPANAARVTDEQRMAVFGTEGKNVSC